jgi:uncharacterized membrane protein
MVYVVFIASIFLSTAHGIGVLTERRYGYVEDSLIWESTQDRVITGRPLLYIAVSYFVTTLLSILVLIGYHTQHISLDLLGAIWVSLALYVPVNIGFGFATGREGLGKGKR